MIFHESYFYSRFNYVFGQFEKKIADFFQCFELKNQHFWKRVGIFRFNKATLQIHIDS